MRTLAAYLWKEWRDHRAVVLGFLIAIPVLLGIAVLVLPTSISRDPILPQVALLGSFAIGLLALGGDLVPGEVRRGQLGFLRRMPADLTTAFFAKLIALLAGLALFSAHGFGVAILFSGQTAVFHGVLDGDVCLIALWLVPWTLAVSCWLPRGALTLPATALLLGLLGLPLYLVYSANSGLRPTKTMALTFAIGVPVGALFVAWFSFARGYRFGRGIGSAALRGLVACVVLVAPAWAYAGYTAHEWRQFDPVSSELCIREGFVGESERYLFLNCRVEVPSLDRDGPVHAVRVDLQTGEWNVEGERGQPFFHEGSPRWTRPALFPVRVVAQERMWGREGYWNANYDARTGRMVKSGWAHLPLPEVEELRADEALRIPDGWRAWGRAGLGYRVFKGSKWRVYDPLREKVFENHHWGSVWNIRVREGRWLVRRHGKDQRDFLLDPETGELEPFRGLPDLRFGEPVSDGGVVYGDQEGVWWFGPESGERALLLEDYGFTCVIHDDRAGHALLIVHRGDDLRYARLALETRTIAFAAVDPREFSPLCFTESGGLIGIRAEREVVRDRFGADEVELLFPR